MHFSHCSKITVSLRYADLLSVLPTRVKVLAWPVNQLKRHCTSAAIANRRDNGGMGYAPIPSRLTYAEEALRTRSLPEGVAIYNMFVYNIYVDRRISTCIAPYSKWRRFNLSISLAIDGQFLLSNTDVVYVAGLWGFSFLSSPAFIFKNLDLLMFLRLHLLFLAY